MTQPRIRRAVIACAAATAVIALSAVPGLPGRVAAADDGIDISTRTIYTLAPDDHAVHVTIDLVARNTIRPTTTGGVVRRSYFPAVHVVIQPEAVDVRATTAGRRLATSVDDRRGYREVEVALRSRLFYEQTARLKVTYDLPGGKPRSKSDIRVGKAFASFYAWANGDRASVRIVLPDAFKPTISGATLDEQRSDGQIVYTADDITDTPGWYAVVDADRSTGLGVKWLSIPTGESIAVRAWPEDRQWQDRVADRLERGMPELHRLVGLPWPVTGPLLVTEVHTPLLEGYAGLYHGDSEGIEISEDLDDQTILHEASHAWFNGGLVDGRWIGEGFADAYAAKALSKIGIYAGPPVDYPRTDPAAFPLNDWPPLGRIDDEKTAAREDYGYQTSFRVMNLIITAAGDDAMRTVLVALADREIAYVGAMPPEHQAEVADWRVLLDDLEERAGSRNATDLFRRYVIGASDVNALAARATARETYATLVEQGQGWLPAYAIRSRMASWEFSPATDQMTTAAAILAQRDRIAAAGAPIGLTAPAALRAAYEGAETDLAPVLAEATTDADAAGVIVTAAARVAEPRDVLTVIGLGGFEPATVVDAARTAYAAGRGSAARDSVTVALTALDRAPEQGRQTVITIVVVGGGLVLFGAILVVRRRREARIPAGAAPGALWGPALVPAATLPSQPSPESAGPAGDPEPTVTQPVDLPADPGPD